MTQLDKMNLSLLKSVEEAEDMTNLRKVNYEQEKKAEYFRFICGEKKAYLKYKQHGFTKLGRKCHDDVKLVKHIEKKPMLNLKKCDEIQDSEEAKQTYIELNEHEEKVEEKELSDAVQMFEAIP